MSTETFSRYRAFRRVPGRARGGFTLAEMMVALTVNAIIMIAGVMMLRAVLSTTTANMDRTLASGEVQDIGQVIEPMLKEAGTGLPIDRGFVPIGYQGDTTSAQVHMLTRDTSQTILNGYRCTDFRNTPTPGCVSVPSGSSAWQGQNVVIVSGSSSAARFVKLTSVQVLGGGRAKLRWDPTASNFGWPPAGVAVQGESGMQVIPVVRNTLIWTARTGALEVTEGLRSDAVVVTWVLGRNVTEFSPALLYLGSVAGGMPSMTGIRFANNITAMRIRYAQSRQVHGSLRSNRRVLTVAPTALVQ